MTAASLHAPDATRDAWSNDLGVRWPWLVAALAVGLALAGWLTPLGDPDLPMHLRTAEWIVHEGRVPFTEPFAWTRAGAPFFAYSWLAELAYLGAFNRAGAQGLHALQAMLAAGSFLVVVALGRVSRWSVWPTLLIAFLSAAMWSLFVVAVRPQALMGITVPLAWLGAELMLRGRMGRGVGVTIIAAALTANTHILFPVTAVPVVRFLAEPRVRWRSAAGFLAFNVVGWLVTPYAMVIPEMMRINFTGNVMIGPQTTVLELAPGFRAIQGAGVSVSTLVLGILLVAPLALPSRLLADRERLAYGFAWVAGLGLFGLAVRGLVIWLVVALPLLARLLSLVPVAPSPGARRLNASVMALIPLALAQSEWRDAARAPTVQATPRTRQLPLGSAVVLEPLVRWVECHVQPPPGTRAYNTFNHGSYLVYRLPLLSYSIDGRNIFPDSVAVAEAMQMTSRGSMRLGPWSSASVAFVPLRHAVAPVIAADSAWRLVRVSAPGDSSIAPTGLWVRKDWLARFGRGPVSEVADTVRPGQAIPPPPASCDELSAR